MKAKIARTRILEQAAHDIRLFGGRADVHPAEALLQLVGAKAAEVAYWESRVAELDHHNLVWGKTKEKQGGEDYGITFEAKPNLALDQLHVAQRDLAAFAASSLKAGVDEALVQVAKSQAAQIVKVLQAALTDGRVSVAGEPDDVILDTIRGMGLVAAA